MPLINGYRPIPEDSDIPTQQTTSVDNTLEAFGTGDYDIKNEGFDDGVVVIEQDLPIRTQVLGVFGKAQSEAT